MSFDLTKPDKPTISKDVDAVLDYSWDWSDWLTPIADTIVSHQIIHEVEGPTTPSSAEAAGVVTAWVSGGTLDTTHRVICRIVTAGGRTEDRSIFLKIKER